MGLWVSDLDSAWPSTPCFPSVLIGPMTNFKIALLTLYLHEFHVGCPKEPVSGDLMFDGRGALEDELLGDPEEAARYLRELEVFNPSLYAIIAEGVKELSAMMDAQHFRGPFTSVKGEPDTTSIALSPRIAANAASEDSRRRYACLECGKLHDRKARANDCRNADLGLKPYVCRGYCGQNPWFVRHLSRPCPSLMHSSQRWRLFNSAIKDTLLRNFFVDIVSRGASALPHAVNGKPVAMRLALH